MNFDLDKALRITERNRRISKEMIMHAERTQLRLFAVAAWSIILLVLFVGYLIFGGVVR